MAAHQPKDLSAGRLSRYQAAAIGARTFERQLYRINVARAQIDRTLVAVPVGKPVFGEVELSSSFGVRMDPFLGRPAVHTGIDLRGELASPCAQRPPAASPLPAARAAMATWWRSVTATALLPAMAICP